MAEIRREAPKFNWMSTERVAQDQLENAMTELQTPRWDKQQLAERSLGMVNEFPEVEALDVLAVIATLGALQKLGVINEDQAKLIPGNLIETIADYVVNERTIYQVEAATRPNFPRILEPASVARKFK